MKLRFALAAALLLAVPASAAEEACEAASAASHWYDPAADGSFALETGVAEARESHRFAVVVFGADWCHDSRALAAVLTSEAFKARFGERFSVTFIDVGKPQTGEGRNLDLVAGLGLKDLHSTPALFVLAGDGKRLNSVHDAVSWKNAQARGEAKILAWFDRFERRHRKA